MKRLLVVLALVPSLAAAQQGEPATSDKTSDNPMARWVPPKVKNEAKNKQEIQALFKSMEAAGKKGDVDAAAALVDFPVTMITDDSKGQGMGEAWSREKWVETMKPFYAKPMKDVKVTHKPTVFLLSDSLATVTDVWTMDHGGKSITSRSSTLLIRRDGQWRVKAMAEGGWGDMATPQTAAGAHPGSGTSPGSTGSASQGEAMPKEPATPKEPAMPKEPATPDKTK
jgi:uncharacterized protein (TIGR02246 family)